MRTYVYPAGLDGCGYYRLIWPARALAAQGHDVTVVMPSDRAHDKYQLSGKIDQDKKLHDVFYPEDADLIVMQRPTHNTLSQAVGLMRAKGVTVIVDMDDDLTKIHPRNPAFGNMHPRSLGDHSWANATYACKNASLVTVSTPALKSVYGAHGRVAVLYNMIEERNLSILHEDDGCFGWTGTILSHPDDPFVMGSAVQRLVDEGFNYRMAGNPVGLAKAFRIRDDQIRSNGVVDSTQWPEEIAKLHVGLAPLTMSAFNSAKSWLKPEELASVGVPCVMSPAVEYRRLHKDHGIGVIATSPKDWFREVKKLMTDDALYEDLSASGREAATHLTIEGNAWRWGEVWEETWKADQSASKPFRRPLTI